MSRITRDQWAMTLASATAQRSTCCRRQVGAVLLNHAGHVIATGYNGVAAGMPHCNELGGGGSGRRFFGQRDREYTQLVRIVTGPRAGQEFEIGAGATLTIQPGEEIVQLPNPKNFPNACPGAFSPSGTNLDSCEAIHAEQNALLQCRDVREIHTCFCTASPCITCTKLMLSTGCMRIVFLEEYPHPAARALWERAGRVWEQLQTAPSA